MDYQHVAAGDSADEELNLTQSFRFGLNIVRAAIFRVFRIYIEAYQGAVADCTDKILAAQKHAVHGLRWLHACRGCTLSSSGVAANTRTTTCIAFLPRELWFCSGCGCFDHEGAESERQAQRKYGEINRYSSFLDTATKITAKLDCPSHKHSTCNLHCAYISVLGLRETYR